MADEPYDIGDTVQLTGTFTDANGALADPTTVVCRLLKPDGTTATLTATKQSTGVYTATATIDQDGTHWFRFTGSGTVGASDEDILKVQTRRVA